MTLLKIKKLYIQSSSKGKERLAWSVLLFFMRITQGIKGDVRHTNAKPQKRRWRNFGPFGVRRISLFLCHKPRRPFFTLMRLSPKRLSGSRPAAAAVAANSQTVRSMDPVSIYIHWPYCTSKCTYCSFNKYVDPKVDHDRMERALVQELETELKCWGLDKLRRPVRSVYFGGGTPSLARVN